MEKPETKEGQALSKMQQARSGLVYGLEHNDRLIAYANDAIADLNEAIDLLTETMLGRKR